MEFALAALTFISPAKMYIFERSAGNRNQLTLLSVERLAARGPVGNTCAPIRQNLHILLELVPATYTYTMIIARAVFVELQVCVCVPA